MNSTNQVMSAFLRTILLRMKALGLNQTALARRMNVSRAYVSKVLRGEEVNFSFATAMRFASALEMDFVPKLRKARKRLSSRSRDTVKSVPPSPSPVGLGDVE